MNRSRESVFAALGLAAQWRLLLLWVLALWLPTLLVALPLWRALSGLLDHSLSSTAWASAIDLTMFTDVGAAFEDRQRGLASIGLAGVVLTLLLTPFLAGAVVTAVREGRVVGLGGLVHGGIALYGRMLRMMAWSLVPLGIAAGIGSAALRGVRNMAEHAILASDVQVPRIAAIALTAVLLVLAHASIEAGRAQFALPTSGSSAVKAWWRGLRTMRRAFLPLIGMYLLVSAIGLALAALLALARAHVPAASGFGALVALLIAQLSVLALAWARAAKLASAIVVTRRLAP